MSKTYEIHWSETKCYKMELKAKSEEQAQKKFEKWYNDFDLYQKKIEPEADYYDGTYEGVFYTEERK